jgi:muramidase (phage lysozyme)
MEIDSMTSAPEITPAAAGGVNVCAFLSMLAWSEGTDNGKQPTKDRGYDVIVGGQLFKGYADHPRVLVALPKLGIQSTAAGRYQLLRRYYDSYKKTLGLKDFSPLSQDLIALQQIRERRALPLIQAGKIEDAIARVRNIWESLPGAGYGQPEHKLSDLLAVYRKAGGTVAQ